MLRFLCRVALSLALLPAAAQATEFEGRIRVIDGDTLEVGRERVRLHGIDAPERDQPCRTRGGQSWSCGDWATRQVRDRYQGARARCEALEQDRYGRTVARCAVGGEDMGRTLVREGIAFAYARYSRAYLEEERAAKGAGRGIHAFELEAPARYRLSQRRGAAAPASPAGCAIKGNISRKGVRIYHLPGQSYYAETRISPDRGERYFCSEAEARAAGWRRARR
jgi:endonuclease YncB( thermonuclease family)